jgi:4-hydroxy-tetrahydrodipicolinate synthase
MDEQLYGIIPAILTPLTEDREPDLGLLAKQTEYLASSGAHGFFIGGTTSEGAFLSTEQKRLIFKTVKKVSAGRQFLCLAALQPSTPQVVKEMHVLEDLEPDFFVAVTPFYGMMDQQTIKDHFTILARESSVPLILYNIPGRTQSPMAVKTVLELSREDNIAGIKDSSGDFIFFSQGFLGEYPDDFIWIMGDDALDASALLLGAGCIVTGLGNIRIEHYIDMYNAAKEGNSEKVKECQRIVNRYRSIFNVCSPTKGNAAVKSGTAFYGRANRRMIMPSMNLNDEEYSKVDKILSDINR